jgi:hypothetical protein
MMDEVETNQADDMSAGGVPTEDGNTGKDTVTSILPNVGGSFSFTLCMAIDLSFRQEFNHLNTSLCH